MLPEERRWSFCEGAPLFLAAAAVKSSSAELAASPLLPLLVLLLSFCGGLALVAGGTFSVVIFSFLERGERKSENEKKKSPKSIRNVVLFHSSSLCVSTSGFSRFAVSRRISNLPTIALCLSR